MSELRSLPSVDRLLRHEDALTLISEYGRPLTLDSIRETLDSIRTGKVITKHTWSEAEIFAHAGVLLKDWTFPTLTPVINATGVILHTNLGRAPFGSEIDAPPDLTGYFSLEYDLDGGGRGSRSDHAEKFLTRLTGAEAALVVNNNAAAILLALSALCKRKRVIISRTQLVEIGGGFRVPEVLAQSGAKMVEIGATNRVHTEDYENALTEGAGAVLRAHHSNYKLTGFTSEPSLQEMAEIAHRYGALLIDDLGSGALLDTAQFGLAHEPMVQESITAGADLVCFSGDKLLGGPQAGIIIGKRGLIARIKRHPLARAVRIDKLSLIYLCWTLNFYLRDDIFEIPVWSMMAMSVEQLDYLANKWQKALRTGEVIDGFSTIGGGSLPGETLPTRLLAIKTKSPKNTVANMRALRTPIIARIEKDRILIDPRTVLPGQENDLIRGLERAIFTWEGYLREAGVTGEIVPGDQHVSKNGDKE
jgi:L-seryl-tRNA(Ser) seleniumtransferase